MAAYTSVPCTGSRKLQHTVLQDAPCATRAHCCQLESRFAARPRSCSPLRTKIHAYTNSTKEVASTRSGRSLDLLGAVVKLRYCSPRLIRPFGVLVGDSLEIRDTLRRHGGVVASSFCRWLETYTHTDCEYDGCVLKYLISFRRCVTRRAAHAHREQQAAHSCTD